MLPAHIQTEEQCKEAFLMYFGSSPDILVRAPGRINLLGEHTDYNQGFVLPAAIDFSLFFAIRPRTDKFVTCVAHDFQQEKKIFSLENTLTPQQGWINHILGVVHEFTVLGFHFPTGFDVLFGGNIPSGAGLSSSAALEAGLARALCALFDWEVSLLTLAQIAQRAEHHFVGVKCGIMDMYASLFGQRNQLIQLDCRTQTHAYIPFELKDYVILLANSGVKHSLAESAYNARRASCEEGVTYFQSIDASVQSLRDVSLAFFYAHASSLPEEIQKRCLYVIEEQARVVQVVEALKNNDWQKVGSLMYATHRGLSELYEVSCVEIDFLVNLTKKQNGVLGARVMGGGFGGCTIQLVEKEQKELFKAVLQKEYKKTFDLPLEIYEVTPEDGVRVKKV
mgnify:FL=1|jgi:galactokinase